MKSFTSLSLALLFSDAALAFPAALWQAMEAEHAGSNQAMREALQKRQIVPPGFNPTLQYVSNTGAHAFVAPSGNDQRGPCPGLNAMANHGYLPHNGVATIDQFVTGTNQVFGMGLDLALFLSAYGAAIDGDLTRWSIGGPTPALPGILGLSQPQGISGSHNKYESDASPTRGDLYQKGNDYLLQMDQFKDLYSQPLGPRGYDLTTLTNFRAKRFQQSIEQNPYFFNGPFTGVAVQPAAYTFIYRFMANKSAEYPDGYLNGDVLKSFFSVTGNTPDQFQYKAGYERIPDNWYKRAIGDEYTIPFFQVDLLAAALQYPQFLSIGGNTGKVNTFTGVDLQDVTGGVYNTQTLAQGNNAFCFATQFLQQAVPDLLKGLTYTTLTNALASTSSALSCPKITKIDDSQFSKFPGYTQSYSGYSPAAHGL